ncbi:hypothetical protein [Glycomyces buryatensis]|uniref:YbaB/EbfC family nucleoid-associated protein n=1 Tax=Glycomyces buryatensis TaxID=2570927 RepID=A0A4S8QE76_9ACTN|nr:hypothetical protein [Glycomyces buryatensis]THV41392.1 hypothetical protein FAB82_11365 [Glycomyces buryatensis]
MTPPDDGAPPKAHLGVPDDYELQIDEARATLEKLPHDENWENAQRLLNDPPARGDVEAFAEQFADAQAVLEKFAKARYVGTDENSLTAIAIDSSGRLCKIQFDVAASGAGNHALAASLLAAWDAAETERERGAADLTEGESRRRP